MDASGPSSSRQADTGGTYIENAARSVRIYIDELRSRLAELQTEGDEIERTTDNILGEAIITSIDLSNVKLGNSVETEDKNSMPASKITIGAVVSEATGFTSLLQKFENMKNINETSPGLNRREEPEEIRQLREKNGSIREKIRQIQTRIEQVQRTNSCTSRSSMSRETFVEEETCTQLYEATAETLKKVAQIEKDIRSVESFFNGTRKDLPIEMKKDRKMRTTNY